MTRGTYIDEANMDYESRYTIVILERNLEFGIVFLDTTTHEFHVGEFKDNEYRYNLKTIITRTNPIEIVYSESFITPETMELLKSFNYKPTLTRVKDFKLKGPKDAFAEIEKYFEDSEIPELLANFQEAIQQQAKKGVKESKIQSLSSLHAVSLCLQFLENIMLADTVFSMGIFTTFDLMLEKKGHLYLDSQAI